MVVLEATSGMNLPLKVGPMLSLADMAVVTKIDRVSQAEREVFRARIQDVAPSVRIREVNALYGIGIDPLVEHVHATPDAGEHLLLRGNPPVGTCTICVGKKEVGWQSHFGVVRPLENQLFYRGRVRCLNGFTWTTPRPRRSTRASPRPCGGGWASGSATRPAGTGPGGRRTKR